MWFKDPCQGLITSLIWELLIELKSCMVFFFLIKGSFYYKAQYHRFYSVKAFTCNSQRVLSYVNAPNMSLFVKYGDWIISHFNPSLKYIDYVNINIK